MKTKGITQVFILYFSIFFRLIIGLFNSKINMDKKLELNLSDNTNCIKSREKVENLGH
jgi:hypothetical protein